MASDSVSPTSTETSTRRGTGGEGFPHASPAPAIVAAGLFFIAVGLLWLPALPVGIVVFVVGCYRWTKEYTIDEFERGIVPEQKRRLLGYSSGTITIGLVILSEIVVFGSLFATLLYLEAVNGPWPPAGLALDLPFAIGLTIVLVSSGVTLHWAQLQIERDNRRRFMYGILATFVLGSLFLVGQLYEYTQFMARGLTPTAGPYGASFYALTGMHGAHVAAGLVLIGIIGLRGWRRGHFSADRHLMVKTTAIYWHFVDAVWLIILVVVYVRFGA